MSELRKLNSLGMSLMQQFLVDVVADPTKSSPTSLLTDATTSEPLPINIEVQQQHFSSRMEAASYLHTLLGTGVSTALDREPGVWAWLSLLFFDQLCPLSKDGQRKPGQLARWIPSGHAWRYYRHLLAGPYLIYKAFREDPSKAAIILCGPVDAPGEIVEQLASRQELIQNKALIAAATELYLNRTTGKPKRGVTNKGLPGTIRRFADLVNQLDVNWDLFSMNSDEFLNRLPSEFEVFRKAA